MTVIAWDGKTLAADKRGSDNGIARTVTKIRRTKDGHLIGTSGGSSRGMELAAWYEAGAIPAEFPATERDEDKCAMLVVIRPGPSVVFFMANPYGKVFEDEKFAMGSGRDFATTCMHLGMEAKEAVRIASELDMNCGNGIDVLSLE